MIGPRNFRSPSDHRGKRDLVTPGADVTRTEMFRRLRASSELASERAAIVEAKRGRTTFRAIGQIEAYRVLLERDYGVTVDELILVTEERDPIIDFACSLLEIRVVDVRK